MKLSIIVPVYNTGKYLKRCLNSLVNQTLDSTEIILINDGSTDDSEEIIKKFEEEFPKKIVFINKPNGGQGSARNIGIKKAKGEYIGFVDSDDYVSKDMYKNMYETAKINNSDIVICSIKDYYEKTKETKDRHLNLKEDVTINEALIKSIPSVVNKIYKRKLLKDLLFDEHIWYEDLPYSMQAILKAQKINYIDEGYYYYFHRTKSTMHNENIEKNTEILHAFEMLLSYMKEKDLYDKYRQEIDFLILKEAYIATINRVIDTKNKYSLKTKVIKEIKEYVKENHIIKNKYFNDLPFSYKLSYYLIKFRLYFVIQLLFNIRRKGK